MFKRPSGKLAGNSLQRWKWKWMWIINTRISPAIWIGLAHDKLRGLDTDLWCLRLLKSLSVLA